MQLKNLVGDHIFSGIETGTREFEHEWGGPDERNYVKFILDGVTYMAVEDPADGYRSYMEELKVVDEPCKTKLPDIPVHCEHVSSGLYDCTNDLLEFYDKTNNKIFLVIGTENTDDYYPYCLFKYEPENLAINANIKED